MTLDDPFISTSGELHYDIQATHTTDNFIHVPDAHLPHMSPSRHSTSSNCALQSNTDTDTESDTPTPRRQKRRNVGSQPGSSWERQKRLKQESSSDGFRPHETHLRNFQGKILEDDAKAEFSMSDLRKVRCSACSKWVVMKVLYDLTRWKEHRDSARCKSLQKKLLRTPSLKAYGFGTMGSNRVQVLKPTNKSPPLLAPCPGLTTSSDSRIATYLLRSSVLGGGSRSRSQLSQQLFTGRLWKDLEAHEKRVVLRREELEYKWRNSRAVGAVYATNCLRDIPVDDPSTDPSPCSACNALRHLRVFQTRINLPMPTEENFKFVPKSSRCPQLGAIYLKYKGVRELVEKVCFESLVRR